jgi:hypothetical protein
MNFTLLILIFLGYLILIELGIYFAFILIEREIREYRIRKLFASLTRENR